MNALKEMALLEASMQRVAKMEEKPKKNCSGYRK